MCIQSVLCTVVKKTPGYGDTFIYRLFCVKMHSSRIFCPEKRRTVQKGEKCFIHCEFRLKMAFRGCVFGKKK